jgi:dihydrofolate reductase
MPPRKLRYHVAMSVDGFIARGDGSTDCFPGDLQAEHVTDYLFTLAAEYDTVLMGRATYEVGLRFGVSDPYPQLDTYVFSRTMKARPDPRVHLVGEDVAGVVRGLKARTGQDVDWSQSLRGAQAHTPKDLYLCGGGDLARTLFAEGLIDEVQLKVNPVLLGAGKPLVEGLPRDVPLELLSTKTYRTGVVLARYAVRGA